MQHSWRWRWYELALLVALRYQERNLYINLKHGWTLGVCGSSSNVGIQALIINQEKDWVWPHGHYSTRELSTSTTNAGLPTFLSTKSRSSKGRKEESWDQSCTYKTDKGFYSSCAGKGINTEKKQRFQKRCSRTWKLIQIKQLRKKGASRQWKTMVEAIHCQRKKGWEG